MSKSKKGKTAKGKTPRPSAEQREADLRDPSKTDRLRSPDYKEVYCNRIEIAVNPNDVRLKFIQMMGNREPGHGGKMVIEEKSAVTMSHEHAMQFQKVFGELVERNIHFIGITEEDAKQIKDPKMLALIEKARPKPE